MRQAQELVKVLAGLDGRLGWACEELSLHCTSDQQEVAKDRFKLTAPASRRAAQALHMGSNPGSYFDLQDGGTMNLSSNLNTITPIYKRCGHNLFPAVSSVTKKEK